MPTPFVEALIVRCDLCDEPTWLLTSSLERKLGYRFVSSTGADLPFFACPHCNTVAQPHIAGPPELRNPKEAPQPPTDRVLFGALLGCVQKGCKSHIEVLATVKRGTTHTQARNECQKWSFGVEVLCEDRRRPACPPQIVSSWIEE